MPLAAKIWQRIEVVDDQGATVFRSGPSLYDQPQIVAATLGKSFPFDTIVADDYTRLTLWSAGDGGLASFDFCYIISDKDLLLELTEDVSGTPLYSVLPLRANVGMVLGYDDIANVITVNNSATTMDVVDRIAVQRNAADAVGDARVRGILIA